MIKVGISGATGYAGGELVRILTGHREAEIKWYGSRSYIDKKYADVYQNMFQIIDAVCMDDNMEELASHCLLYTSILQMSLADHNAKSMSSRKEDGKLACINCHKYISTS